MGGQAEHGRPTLYGASPSQLPLKREEGITSEHHHLAADTGERRRMAREGVPPLTYLMA